MEAMECPVCGCPVDVGEGEPDRLVQCDCCGTLWLFGDRGLDHILVGPEG